MLRLPPRSVQQCAQTTRMVPQAAPRRKPTACGEGESARRRWFFKDGCIFQLVLAGMQNMLPQRNSSNRRSRSTCTRCRFMGTSRSATGSFPNNTRCARLISRLSMAKTSVDRCNSSVRKKSGVWLFFFLGPPEDHWRQQLQLVDVNRHQGAQHVQVRCPGPVGSAGGGSIQHHRFQVLARCFFQPAD